MGIYRLKKSRDILHETFKWFQKNRSTLPDPLQTELEQTLIRLDRAVIDKNRSEASTAAQEVETLTAGRIKKGFLHYIWEIGAALVIAFIIAVAVRQMWFELYEIPTGSMRPTFKERDHVAVTKTAFGINAPLQTDHLYFDPSLIKRSGVVIFSADQLPMIGEVDTLYFGILPYKKRFIKRMIGKPGDTLYFYGGQIYGIDAEGKEIRDLIDSPNLKEIEYIPFISFEGQPYYYQERQTVFFRHFNQTIGKIGPGTYGRYIGEIPRKNKWVIDNPLAERSPHKQIETYSDFWGMRNYGMVRLITYEELSESLKTLVKEKKDALLYLEISHTPTVTDLDSLTPWKLSTYTTILPLNRTHLDRIMGAMYTARFIVKNGQAKKYEVESPRFSANSPSFPGIPDGMYEFYHGKGYSIGFGGTASELPSNHPLYNHSAENIQRLFNLGINFDRSRLPESEKNGDFPNRYVYFREGALFLLGSPILNKDDPTLVAFNEQEQQREKQNSRYVAFKDYGPPLADGHIDTTFINTFGLHIPEKHYIVLGDNHAMSADSRVFGFLPEKNIQGAPSLILWPFGERWGFPNQPHYPFLNTPRLIIWTIVGIIALVAYAIHYRKIRKPLFSQNQRNSKKS